MYDGYWSWYKKTDRDEYQRSTFAFLLKKANEHYEFLSEIRKREYDVKSLAEGLARRENESEENLPEPLQKLSEAMVQLVVALEQAELSEEEIEKRKKEAKKRNYAARKWWEQREHIDELRKTGGNFFWSRKSDYQELEAYQELERVKENIMTSSYDSESDYHFEGWDEEYELKRDFENFLWDISNAHCSLRCDLDASDAKSQIQNNVDRYLANPSWHSRMLTDFMLVDFFDTEMLLLEGEFQLGHFPHDVRNKIGNGFFWPVMDPDSYLSWKLRPNERQKRKKWRMIHIGIGFILLNLPNVIKYFQNISESSPNGGLPSWASNVIIVIGFSFLGHVFLGVLLEWIDKYKKRNRKISEAVGKFVMIRDEISEGNYYPARLIERLKQLEDLNLIVPSLIYPLLELRKNQFGEVNSAH